MQELSQKAQELKEKSVITIAVQASNIEQAKIDEWVKESNINTTIGMIQSKQEQTLSKWGVISLPWLILTDKSHIVTAEGFGLSELDEKIEDGGEKPGG